MKKIFIFSTAMLALAACSNNEEPASNDPVAIKVTATIGTHSRASGTTWAAGDKIGITTLRNNENHYINVEYTTANGNGEFTGEPMYFHDKTDPVTFTAYYPFTGTAGTAPSPIQATTDATKQTLTEQPNFDFLWDQRTGITGAEHQVQFNFAHQMSKLTLIFKNGTGAHVSKITSYTISGLKMEGSFNPATGKAEPTPTATAADLTMTTENVQSGEAVTPSLILFPQNTGTSAVTLTIGTDDGQKYGCTLSFSGGEMASGNDYRFTITVNRTGLDVQASTIQDWNQQELTGEATLKE